ncbi:MAG: hypothetical protein IT380_21605 [Myxococcales bacterium]|nr:hypothetical protein [Myxococcales bacterium]
MKSNRPSAWLLAIAFVAGCAATAAFQVPRARADAQGLVRWEHWCVDVEGLPKNSDLERAGAEGWEMVSATFRPPVVDKGSSVGGGATMLCFKRPR